MAFLTLDREFSLKIEAQFSQEALDTLSKKELLDLVSVQMARKFVEQHTELIRFTVIDW